MSLKLRLESISEWVKDVGKVAEGIAEAAVESDLLEDLGDVGGVAGALCRIGARVLPQPTVEQRITRTLVTAALGTLDSFGDDGVRLSKEELEQYLRDDRGERTTRERLAADFSWLALRTPRGMKPYDEWPMVAQLADLVEAWFVGAKTPDGPADEAVIELGRQLRGRAVEAMVSGLAELTSKAEVKEALEGLQERVSADALAVLAELESSLDRYLLFGEVPQDQLYIPRYAKMIDLAGHQGEYQWEDVEVGTTTAEEAVCNAVVDSSARLVVLEGEMGVGKSCLMRRVAALVAQHYAEARKRAPLYGRWRDLYAQHDLPTGIAEQLYADYGVAIDDLDVRENLVYLIDGFDEMSSHDEGHIHACFQGFLDLVSAGCSVVVAMRSTVVTQGLRKTWQQEGALVIRLEGFTEEMVDAWADKWSALQQAEQAVDGDRLRSVTDDPEVFGNPLLLYMTARHILPLATDGERDFPRADIFRIFVDETVTGKVQASREYFPTDFTARDYRLVLQELAAIATRPDCNRRCPWHTAKRVLPDEVLKELSMPGLRTAFVLHFFDPGGADEFVFQPDGFRQYLLAEWLVRTQLEALPTRTGNRDHPLVRDQSSARNQLAQLTMTSDEHGLLNDVYERLGNLVHEDGQGLVARLEDFAVEEDGPESATELLESLYQHVRMEAQDPPSESWHDEGAGAPAGQEVPRGLRTLRMLVNYWEQSLVALFALYRGLGKDPLAEAIFHVRADALSTFWQAAGTVRGLINVPAFNLSHLGLQECQLGSVPGWRHQQERPTTLTFEGANLSGASIQGQPCFYTVQDGESGLTRFGGGPLLDHASFRGATMVQCHLDTVVAPYCDFSEADLTDASLNGCDLRRSAFTGAKLVRAKLQMADVRDARFNDADLTGADFDSAKVEGADFTGANGADVWLVKMARRRKRHGLRT